MACSANAAPCCLRFDDGLNSNNVFSVTPTAFIVHALSADIFDYSFIFLFAYGWPGSAGSGVDVIDAYMQRLQPVPEPTAAEKEAVSFAFFTCVDPLQ